jgi:hypothetical protein
MDPLAPVEQKFESVPSASLFQSVPKYTLEDAVPTKSDMLSKDYWKRIANKASSSFGTMALEGKQLMSDLGEGEDVIFSMNPGQEADVQAGIREGKRATAAPTAQFESIPAELVGGTAAIAPQMAALAAGGPLAGVASFGLGQFLDTYGTGRVEGYSSEKSALTAALTGTESAGLTALMGPAGSKAEALLGKVPMGKLESMIGVDAVKHIVAQALVGMGLMPAMNEATDLTEKVSYRPDQTWGEYLQDVQARLPHEVLMGGVTGAAFGAAGQAAKPLTARLGEWSRAREQALLEQGQGLYRLPDDAPRGQQTPLAFPPGPTAAELGRESPAVIPPEARPASSPSLSEEPTAIASSTPAVSEAPPFGTQEKPPASAKSIEAPIGVPEVGSKGGEVPVPPYEPSPPNPAQPSFDTLREVGLAAPEKPEHIRLYRVEVPGEDVATPGRWYTSSLEEAQGYRNDLGSSSKLRLLDLPIEEAEKFRGDKQGEGVKKFTAAPDREYYVPKDISDGAWRIPFGMKAERIERANAALDGRPHKIARIYFPEIDSIKPGEVKLTSSIANDPHYQNAAALLTRWVKAFGLDGKFLLGGHDLNQWIRGTPMRDAAGGFSTFTDEGTHIMAFSPRWLGDERAGGVIAHEFGHTLMRIMHNKASPEVQQALQNEYLDWLKKHEGGNFQTMMRDFLPAGLEVESRVPGSNMAVRDPLPPEFQRFFSKGEWLANQFARYMESHPANRGLIERFFEKMKAIYSKFFNSFHNEFAPNATFAEWVKTLHRPFDESFAKEPLTENGGTNREETDRVTKKLSGFLAPEGLSRVERDTFLREFRDGFHIEPGEAKELNDLLNPRRKGGAIPQDIIRALTNAFYDPLRGFDTKGLLAALRENILDDKAFVAGNPRDLEIPDGEEFDEGDHVKHLEVLTELERKGYPSSDKLRDALEKMQAEGLTVDKLPQWMRPLAQRLTGKFDRLRLERELKIQLSLPVLSREGNSRIWEGVGGRVVGRTEATDAGLVRHIEGVENSLIHDLELREAARDGIRTVFINGEEESVDPVLARELVDNGFRSKLGTDLGGLVDEISFKGIYDYVEHERQQKRLRDRLGADADRFGWFSRFVQTTMQIAKKNAHIPGVVSYLEHQVGMYQKKMEWVSRADNTLKSWDSLAKDQGQLLSQLKIEETLNGKFFTKQELTARGLHPEALKVADSITKDFRDMLGEMEQAAIQQAMRIFQSGQAGILFARGTSGAKALADIRNDFNKMRATPYFPISRFGDYGVAVKAARDFVWQGKQYKTGNRIAVEMYETRVEQKARLQALRQELGSNGLVTDFEQRELNLRGLHGLPPQMAEMIARQVQLTPKQVKELKQLQYDLAPSTSFIKHLKKRGGINGFSQDAMRAYAGYFQRGASWISRLHFMDLLERDVKDIRDSARANSKLGLYGGPREQLANHFDRQLNAVRHPENDLASLRAFGFFWYLGFNVKSAVVNTTQVPMLTFPYLSHRYGTVRTIGALTKAYAKVAGEGLMVVPDTVLKATGGKPKAVHFFSPEEVQMYEKGVKAGFLDESQVSMLAGYSDPPTLARLAGVDRGWQRGIRRVSMWSGWLFQQAELLNRAVTALATHDLARQHGLTVDEAFKRVKDAVDTTQFEYASWNRPEIMTGKKSALFLFSLYTQHVMHFAFGGDPAWKRFWVTQLAIGGLLGLPGAEDMADVLDVIRSKFSDGKAPTNSRLEFQNWLKENIGEYLHALHVNTDLLFHGISRYSFGLAGLQGLGVPMPAIDFSGSVSLGRARVGPLQSPIAEPFGSSPRSADELLARKMQDLGGPLVSIPFNLIRSYLDDKTPDQFKRWEGVMPIAVKAVGDAWKSGPEAEPGSPMEALPWWLQAGGGYSDRQGNLVYPYDFEDPVQRAEHFLKYFNFTSTAVNKRYERANHESKLVEFYTEKRSQLLNSLAIARQHEDREAVADSFAAIREFNSSIPFKELSVSGKDIAEVTKRRELTKFKREHEMAPSKKFTNVYRKAIEDVSE